MHEASICEHLLALLDQEARRHGVSRIVRLRLEIGRLSCLEPEALRFAFAVMAPGTIAEAAELQIDQPPVRATCQDCGASVAVDGRFGPCGSCGGDRLEMHGGAEMRLLEMEAA
jgi:hydrogenase nickel incorporation protein HypA/HybF